MASSAVCFGAPLTDPGGKLAASRSGHAVPGAEPAGDVGDEVHEAGVLLDAAQVVDLDGARPADAGQVVAHEVHDHDVLGVVLGQQRVGGARGALDGSGRDPLAATQEVRLR